MFYDFISACIFNLFFLLLSAKLYKSDISSILFKNIFAIKSLKFFFAGSKAISFLKYFFFYLNFEISYFYYMENSRQKKVSKILQKDIAEILQDRLKKQGTAGVIISVTRVDLSVDFSVAKVFLSIFPSAMSKQILKEISIASNSIKHVVSQKAKNQLRRVPSLSFHVDDSLDYIEKIESSLKGLDDPIKSQKK